MKPVVGITILLLSTTCLVAGDPQPANWPVFIEEVRTHVLRYTDNLPNFICTEVLQRHADIGRDSRVVMDEVVAEVSFYQKTEHVRVLTVAGKKAPSEDMASVSGMRSTGEFGGSLRALFQPATKARFTFDGYEKVRDRQTIRVKYAVAVETSRNAIGLADESVVTAYQGRFWVDSETKNIVRLEDRAVNIPAGFVITLSESSTDYAPVEIAGVTYWLPAGATVRLVAESGPYGKKRYDLARSVMGPAAPPNYQPPRVEATNIIRYENYHKFEAKVRIY